MNQATTTMTCVEDSCVRISESVPSEFVVVKAFSITAHVLKWISRLQEHGEGLIRHVKHSTACSSSGDCEVEIGRQIGVLNTARSPSL